MLASISLLSLSVYPFSYLLVNHYQFEYSLIRENQLLSDQIATYKEKKVLGGLDENGMNALMQATDWNRSDVFNILLPHFKEEGLIYILSENAQILKFHIPCNINGHSFELQLLLYYTAVGRMAAEKPFEAKIESWCYFSRA